MSSRDRTDRNRDASQDTGDASGNANASRPAGGWEFDPAEINRYLSGGSSRAGRTPRSTSGNQQAATPGRRTSDSLEQLRRTRQQVQQTGQQPAATPSDARPPRSRVSGPANNPQPPRNTSYESSAESSWPTTEATTTARPRMRPAEPVETHDEVAGFEATPDWDDATYIDEADEAAPAASRAPRLTRPHLTRPQLTVPRAAELPRPAVPAFIKGADLANDATALALIGLSLLSLAIMAILVANRISGVASPFATHVSASGALEHFEKNTAIWRLPLLSAMFFLMNFVAAWFISPTDRFLSRFLLGVSAVVQLVAWIALIHFLW